MRFEIGKTYQHTSGKKMTIVGSAHTKAYGWCLIGEENDGYLKPIGTGDDGYAQNWEEVNE